MSFIINFILFFLCGFHLLKSLSAATEEICNWEIFQPRCSSNEIIIIEKALFGRKTMGRCLVEEGVSSENNLGDLKFLGCHADVRTELERQCSGKQQCDVTVAKINVETNCHKWLKFHLEIDYRCLPVVQDSRHCKIETNNGRQHVSTTQLLRSSCGSKTQPWLVESLVGQRVRVSLLYLSTAGDANGKKFHFETKSSGVKTSCHRPLGMIAERVDKKETIVCLGKSGLSTDYTDFYVSDSNNIEVFMFTTSGNDSISYVLAFEATGCSDLIPPADAWLKRTENEAIIGCYSTRLRWQLKCQGQRWIGVIGNCSVGESYARHEESVVKSVAENSNDDFLVPILVIVMAGVVVCFFIICLGVVLINRYHVMVKTKALKLNYKMDSSYGNNAGSVSCPMTNRFQTVKNEDRTFFDQNNTLAKDGVQYFELDESLVSKELIANNA